MSAQWSCPSRRKEMEFTAANFLVLLEYLTCIRRTQNKAKENNPLERIAMFRT